jgi:predicted phosphodiesterase
MKIGIVADTHSNLHALQAVLEHMDTVGVEKRVHLGDIVGYGPKPNETLALTLEKFNYIIKGNHDYACEDDENSWGFNPMAKQAIDWTVKKLSKEEIEVLANLPYAQNIGDTLFVHGSPNAPFEYILDVEDAKLAFMNNDFKLAFVGHTHSPFVWYEQSFDRPKFENTLVLNNYGNIGAYEVGLPNRGRAIVNVGSVGQSRDGDNRATYAVYDTDENSVVIYKIPYAVERTIGLMQREGFSPNACQRLLFGR